MGAMTPAEARGLKIKRARERLGWTQRDLGEHVGASHKSIGNWERGKTSPRNRTGALEAVLGISLNGNDPSPQEVYTDPTEQAIMALNAPERLRLDWVEQYRRAKREPARRPALPPAQ